MRLLGLQMPRSMTFQGVTVAFLFGLGIAASPRDK